jgi:HK97 family phage major capsid protein
MPNASAGVSDMLFGHPLYVEHTAPSVATGQKPIVFGSVRDGYVLRYAGDLEIAYSDDYAYTSFLRTYRWNLSFDGEIRIGEALRLMTMA